LAPLRKGFPVFPRTQIIFVARDFITCIALHATFIIWVSGGIGRRAGTGIETMFTTDNTEGYTTVELAALNAELAARLAAVDFDERADVEKAFHDEVAAR
jgi:hypothetical protein